jgi:hypothetical protein
MSLSEFKHLKKEQLSKRVKIFNALIYVSAAIGIASFVVFFITHDKYNWSWLLIGVTDILMSVNFIGQIRRMRKEIQFREAPKNSAAE